MTRTARGFAGSLFSACSAACRMRRGQCCYGIGDRAQELGEACEGELGLALDALRSQLRQHPRLLPGGVHERGLADTGLTAENQQPARTWSQRSTAACRCAPARCDGLRAPGEAYDHAAFVWDPKTWQFTQYTGSVANRGSAWANSEYFLRARLPRGARRGPPAARRGCCRVRATRASSPSQSVTTPPASRTITSAPAATSHGPRPQLEVAVEHALGGPAQVEAGGADPAEILEPVERRSKVAARTGQQVLAPEREAGRDDRLLGARGRSPQIGRPSRNAPPARARRRSVRSSSGACTTPTTGHAVLRRARPKRRPRRSRARSSRCRRAGRRATRCRRASPPPPRRTPASPVSCVEDRRAPRPRSRCRLRSPSRRAPSRERRRARRSARRHDLAAGARGAFADREQRVEIERRHATASLQDAGELGRSGRDQLAPRVRVGR